MAKPTHDDDAVQDGWLSRFPGELRNQNYKHPIASRDLAMRRTNSKISRDSLSG